MTNGTEYDVQVRAVDENDVDGAWSATTSATPADHGNTRAAATSVTAGARVWGAIDPADDEDYFSFSVSRTADYWIYSLGDLDTVGELLDSGGMSIDISDRGGMLPKPDNFFLWRRLQSGTYYIKVTGYGSTDEPYILRIREFRDTTSRSNAATLNLNGSASATIDPEDDDDYFKLELSETTEVAIRASGFPDTVGELQRSNGTEIASNDDGFLSGGWTNFLIRESLNAGVYYVKVSSFASSSDGPYTVYATAITEPGSAIADAQPLTLGGTAGGIIDPAGDEDYFSLTLEETTYVIIGGAGEVVNIIGDLTDENDLAAPVDSVHFNHLFFFQGRLDAGTYYLKVTGKDATETGRYTVRAIVESSYTYFVNRCSNIPTSSSINDPLYGCQWHLKNNDQFRNSGGHDIRVEEVWPTYTGSGINVAVVDDGMYYWHEDLTDNVLTSFNHNYDPDLTDIYHPFEDHGTAVAGLIAAKDNSLGMRGVAPDAKIYGYNYLVEQTDANEANAMSRNAATTAISNNSWGSGDFGHPEPAAAIWEAAVKNGVTTGYGGKGVFYAWAAGNGGDDDNSNLDELANFYAVTAVCAVGHDDIRSDYSEKGANLWVCGPSSSGRVGQPRIATTDNGHRYRGSFGGTSAATPIVSGVVALVREANNALTWRDVKLILAASARKNDPDNTGWVEGAFKYGSTTDRYNFNHEYGFGMVDAKAAVDLATSWTNTRDLREITSDSSVINLPIPDLPTSGTPTIVTASLTVDPYVEFVEFVEVNAHFYHSNFRDLTIELVSPSGAVSTLSTTARIAGPLTTEFRFGSARHLGEDAAGEWTLRIKDLERVDTGALRSWSLTIYGHAYVPDTPGVTVEPPSLTVDEGSTNTYTVELNTQPSGDVTVTIVAPTDNTEVTAEPASLTFTTTDWATPQTVTVRAAEDADADDDTAAVTHTVSGYGTVSTAPEVNVTVTDNDTRGVTVSPTSLTIDEGGSGTYTVVLDTQPTGDVMVDIGSDNTDVTVSSSSLTFTTLNWSAEQTVTVTAGQDADAADDAATLTHNPSGADYNSVSNADLAVTVTDDETAGVTVTPTSLTIGEGGSGTYTVVLDTQPTGDVTVTIVDPTDNTDVKAEPAALTFTTINWNSAQTVTVSAVQDADATDDTATVTHTVSGYGSVVTAASVTVTVAEDPTAPYDTNGNGSIDKDEASVSVRGYLSDGTPPKAVASAVVRRYLSGE